MSRRAFAIRELIAVIVVIVIIGSLIWVMIPRSRSESRRQKDGDQIKGLHVGLVMWAQGGPDSYHLPSYYDKANYTLDMPAREKDTTSNIFSMMVSNGTIKPELLVSPLETNRHVVPCTKYEFDKPSGTARPELAIWDPKLSARLDGSQPGNVSYAHLQPAGERKTRWSNTFAANEAVLSNRGPQIASTTPNPDGSVTPTLALPTSNTLRFYGRGKSWSGWAAFNDNHVEFRSDYLRSGKPFSVSSGPLTPTYVNSKNQKLPDLFCHDEPDDPKAANDYLGIFLKAGDSPADFRAAWD
jgi:hypothetical protein